MSYLDLLREIELAKKAETKILPYFEEYRQKYVEHRRKQIEHSSSRPNYHREWVKKRDESINKSLEVIGTFVLHQNSRLPIPNRIKELNHDITKEAVLGALLSFESVEETNLVAAKEVFSNIIVQVKKENKKLPDRIMKLLNTTVLRLYPDIPVEVFEGLTSQKTLTTQIKWSLIAKELNNRMKKMINADDESDKNDESGYYIPLTGCTQAFTIPHIETEIPLHFEKYRQKYIERRKKVTKREEEDSSWQQTYRRKWEKENKKSVDECLEIIGTFVLYQNSQLIRPYCIKELKYNSLTREIILGALLSFERAKEADCLTTTENIFENAVTRVKKKNKNWRNRITGLLNKTILHLYPHINKEALEQLTVLKKWTLIAEKVKVIMQEMTKVDNESEHYITYSGKRKSVLNEGDLSAAIKRKSVLKDGDFGVATPNKKSKIYASI